MFGADSLDIYLGILRFLSIVLAAVFGFLALQKRTGKRRWVPVGIVVTGLVALLLLAFEVVKQRKQQASIAATTLQEVQRFDKTLDSINRSLHIIRNIYVTTILQIPIADQRLAAFHERFAKNVNAAVLRNDLSVTVMESDGGAVAAVSIPSTSRLFPSSNSKSQSELLASSLVNTTNISIHFYKKPVAAKNVACSSSEADLRMVDFESELSLHYDVNNRTLALIRGNYEKQTVPTLKSFGGIVSLPDLRGAQMIVFVGRPGGSLHVSLAKETDNLRQQLRLSSLHIRIDNQDFSFREEQLTRHLDCEQHLIYVYTFPNSLEEIYKATGPH